MGFVYFVGAGSGDPDLITVKGLNLIKSADVILYDSLASDALLSYARADCKLVFVGKRSGIHSIKQEQINDLLVKYAKEKNTVVRLKGGDSFVFGRGGEEAQALDRNDIRYAFIPGVSSCYAVPETAGIPVTHREISRSFTVATGHTKDGSLDEKQFESYAKQNSTLVFLMGLSNLKIICELLIKYGMDKSTPAAVISNGTTDSQKAVRGNLENIYKKAFSQSITAPAIIIVGETAAFNFDKRVKVGITGSKSIKRELTAGMPFANTFDLIEMQINPLDFELPKNIKDYDLIAFLSANAVDIVMQKTALPNDIPIAAIGRKTADRLKEYGYTVSLVPDEFSGKALGKAIADNEYKNVLIFRAKIGAKDIENSLEENGVKYNTTAVYDVNAQKGADFEFADEMDYITFSSGRGAEEFFKLCKVNSKVKYAAIGNATAKILKKMDITPLVAKEFTAQGIAKIIYEDLL